MSCSPHRHSIGHAMLSASQRSTRDGQRIRLPRQDLLADGQPHLDESLPFVVPKAPANAQSSPAISIMTVPVHHPGSAPSAANPRPINNGPRPCTQYDKSSTLLGAASAISIAGRPPIDVPRIAKPSGDFVRSAPPSAILSASGLDLRCAIYHPSAMITSRRACRTSQCRDEDQRSSWPY